MWPTATSCQGRFLRSLSFSTSLDLDIFLSLSISLYSPLVLFTYIQHPHVYFAFSFHISVMSFGVSSFFGMSILAPFPSSHDLGVFLSLSLDLFVFAISLSMYMLLSAILCTYVRITWAFYVFPSLSRCPFLSFSPSSFIASSRSLCLHVLLSPSPFSIFLLFFYSSSLPTYVRTSPDLALFLPRHRPLFLLASLSLFISRTYVRTSFSPTLSMILPPFHSSTPWFLYLLRTYVLLSSAGVF